MADRYEYDREHPSGREHDYGRERNRMRDEERWRGDRDDRGMIERAGDEVRSWFGDEEASRRRERDSREMRDDYARPDWNRNRGLGRDPDYSPEQFRGRTQYGGERGYASGEDIGRSSRAYSSAGRSWSESQRDIDRPDWGWSGSESSRRSTFDRSRSGQGTDRDWGTSSSREDRWIPGGYSYSLFAWSEPGPYTGRGPKGYQRSDDRIREDICDRLTRHGRLDATDIQIQVRNGEVTLEGMVDNREGKRIAEDVAEAVDGVRDVTNHLKTYRGDDRSGSTSSGSSTVSTSNVSGPTVTGATRKNE